MCEQLVRRWRAQAQGFQERNSRACSRVTPHGMELLETMSARQLLTARAASAKNIGLTDFRVLGKTRIAKRSYKQRVLMVTKAPPFSSSG
jgi:hypothetical protein